MSHLALLVVKSVSDGFVISEEKVLKQQLLQSQRLRASLLGLSTHLQLTLANMLIALVSYKVFINFSFEGKII